MCVCVCVCLCVSLSLYMHMYVYVYTCIYKHMRVYVCACIHVSVCEDAKIRQYPLAVVGKGVVEPSSPSSSAGPLHGVAPWHLGGPGHASDGDCLPGEILLKTIDFKRPGFREWLPSGTPFQKNYTFFGSVFGCARVQISFVFSLRSVFFAT